MAVPIAPGLSISLAQIQTEFGGANPIGINEYYRSGTYVGSGVANSTGVLVPTSGIISFISFSGAVAYVAPAFWYSLTDMNLNAFRVNSTEFTTTGNTLIEFYTSTVSVPPTIKALQRTGSNTPIWGSDIGNTRSALGVFTMEGETCGMRYSHSSPTMYYFVRLNSDGTINWSANTSNIWYSAATTHANANSYILTLVGSQRRITKLNQSGSPQWHKLLPSTVLNGIDKHAINLHEDGAKLYLSGYHNSSTQRGLVMSLSSDGAVRWAKNTDSTGILSSIVSSQSNVWTTSGTRIIKWDDSGSILFQRSVSTSELSINSIRADAGGNVYIIGTQAQNTVIMKLNSAGTVQWSRRMGHAVPTGGGIQYSIRPLSGSFSVNTEAYQGCVYAELAYWDTYYNTYYQTVAQEAIFIKFPSDGTKTGTHSNIVYASITAPTLTTTTHVVSNLTVTVTDSTFSNWGTTSPTRAANTTAVPLVII